MSGDARLPDYEYTCTKGHWSAAHKPLGRCVQYVKGKPCPGDLLRIGKGSRGPRSKGQAA